MSVDPIPTRFRVVSAFTDQKNPILRATLDDGTEIVVDLEVDTDGIVVVNVRPGTGCTVDVEMHGRRGSKLMT